MLRALPGRVYRAASAPRTSEAHQATGGDRAAEFVIAPDGVARLAAIDFVP